MRSVEFCSVFMCNVQCAMCEMCCPPERHAPKTDRKREMDKRQRNSTYKWCGFHRCYSNVYMLNSVFISLFSSVGAPAQRQCISSISFSHNHILQTIRKPEPYEKHNDLPISFHFNYNMGARVRCV